MIVAACSGSPGLWQYLFLIELLPAVTSLCLMPFLHESARYLFIIKQQREQAERGDDVNDVISSSDFGSQARVQASMRVCNWPRPRVNVAYAYE